MQKNLIPFGITVGAVLVVLLGFELYQRQKVERHINAAYLAQGLSAAGAVKVAVLTYQQETGVAPSSNAEAGIPEPEEFVGRALRSIEIGNGGRIVLTFSEESGVDQGKIYLTPDFDNPMLNAWECTTPSYKTIENLIPQCEFRQET